MCSCVRLCMCRQLNTTPIPSFRSLTNYVNVSNSLIFSIINATFRVSWEVDFMQHHAYHGFPHQTAETKKKLNNSAECNADSSPFCVDVCDRNAFEILFLFLAIADILQHNLDLLSFAFSNYSNGEHIVHRADSNMLQHDGWIIRHLDCCWIRRWSSLRVALFSHSVQLNYVSRHEIKMNVNGVYFAHCKSIGDIQMSLFSALRCLLLSVSAARTYLNVHR